MLKGKSARQVFVSVTWSIPFICLEISNFHAHVSYTSLKEASLRLNSDRKLRHENHEQATNDGHGPGVHPNRASQNSKSVMHNGGKESSSSRWLTDVMGLNLTYGLKGK